MHYSKEELSEIVKNMAKDLGACDVGIATTESLSGGPPTTDLTVAMDGGKSAIVFAVPFKQDLIELYLSKESFELNENKIRTTTYTAGLALEISRFLDQLGYEALPVAPNYSYRKDTPNGILDMQPVISHRYLALSSGIGFSGFSGHVITKENGAAVVLATVITDAELIPTKALDDDNNYCDKCKLCQGSCVTNYISDEETLVTIGNENIKTKVPKSHKICTIACGGLSGLHPSGKFSTWSPARFEIPKDEKDIPAFMEKSVPASVMRPKESVFYHPVMPKHRMEYT
ncbi:MAG: epoxyqueuosine reductase, partial [Methanobacteriaceae archaeon]